MPIRLHIVAFLIFTSFALALVLIADHALTASLEKRASTLCQVGREERIELENAVVRSQGDLSSCRAELEKALDRCEDEP